MNDSLIASEIKKYGNERDTVFVFPSDVAASLWLEASLELTGAGTMPAERFIAWDRFKEESVQASVTGRAPVSSAVRKLYAFALSRKNAGAGEPFFLSLIPPHHAAAGAIFAPWIARILPQLGLWERKQDKASRSIGPRPGVRPGEEKSPKEKDLETCDLEARDLSLLKTDYGAFLDANSLFEPSWQRPPLRDTGKRYIIFFPDAIEDYTEYASLLGESDFIRTIFASELPGPTPVLAAFGTTREEITALALSVEAAIRQGTAPEKIAVSVPDIETVEPYLLREFSLRGIPFEYRAGFPLGALPAGRLFSLAHECVSTGFSFSSMKALLLDRVVPWKHPELAAALVSFGIRNHCVSSWNENGKTVDVWEEAFSAPAREEQSDWRLADFYRSLSRSLRNLASAVTFSEVRNRYFSFREDFLDMGILSDADDAVLARCVEELNALASLESRFPALAPQNPLSFFISTLDEKKYVAQRARGGVSVFPFRVAAGTPFDRHFIIDASQDSATVLYSQLPFLRQDRRQELNLLDTDASPSFFAIYGSCGATFSFAARTFTGYRTPHGYFAETALVSAPEANPGDADPYAAERAWFDRRGAGPGAERGPDRLHGAQKDGVAGWLASDADKDFTYLEFPFAPSFPSLDGRISLLQMNGSDIRVSQTDLSLFAKCPSRWFLSRLLALRAENADAELLNERNLGILYHDVLKKLYEHIRETDGEFRSANIESYREKARSLAGSAAAEHAEFRGPIAAPLIDSLVKRISDGVSGILERDAQILDGFVPEFLEDDIAFALDGIRYYGKIDRISRRRSDGLAVLIDYKSGRVPSPSAYARDGDARIADFQVPMYVFLAESSPESPYHNSRIEYAWFADIQGGDYRPVINDNEHISHGRKRGMMTRDEFEPAIESFLDAARDFARSVAERNFAKPPDLSTAECLACDFRKICRTTYAVRPG